MRRISQSNRMITALLQTSLPFSYVRSKRFPRAHVLYHSIAELQNGPLISSDAMETHDWFHGSVLDILALKKKPHEPERL